MGSYRLREPAQIDGEDFDTLEDAAYALRKKIIREYDPDGPRIVRVLRNAATPEEALRAEASLQAWLRGKSRTAQRRRVEPLQ